MENNLETHNYNYTLNRFEPRSKECLFCDNKTLNEEMEDNLFTPVYCIQDKTNLLVYRNVKFKMVHIGVPRCKKCKKKHNLINSIANIFMFASVPLLLFLVLLLCFKFEISVLVMMIAFFIGVFTYFLIIFKIEKFIHYLFKIREPDKVALEYSLVDYFLNNGWTFIRPTA